MNKDQLQNRLIMLKLSHILEIVQADSKADKEAAKEHLARFRNLEEKLVRIDQKIINDKHAFPVDYSVEKV